MLFVYLGTCVVRLGLPGVVGVWLLGVLATIVVDTILVDLSGQDKTL